MLIKLQTDKWQIIFRKIFLKIKYYKCCITIELSVNISNIAIIIVKNVDYRCIIHIISKSEVINLSKNFVLKDRGYI